MFVDFLNLKKTDQPPTYPPLFENTTQKVKKRKKVPLTPIEKPPKSPKTPKKQSTARWRVPSSETAESHAREPSTALESHNLTRGASLSPRNRRIPRAGSLHRSGIEKSHALEQSTPQQLRISPRRGPPQ